MLTQGVPSEKLAVVPLSYEAPTLPQGRPNNPSLRVLFLGQVILRKGVQYLLGAARLLERESIRFDVVGQIGISEAAIREAPSNVAFHGQATRDQAENWYRQADVFVLPTLSDGFAITQLEAMAHGLPVITTPCCGDVVTDGVDGFIVPPRNKIALAETLLRYQRESSLLASQQHAAVAKAKQFTQARLSMNLIALEQSLLGN